MLWSSTALTKWTSEALEEYLKVRYKKNQVYKSKPCTLLRDFFSLCLVGPFVTMQIFRSLNNSNMCVCFSRSGSVRLVGLFWWVQPHRPPCSVCRRAADRHRAHLQEGAAQKLCLHRRRQCEHEPRVWHLPHHGQWTTTRCSWFGWGGILRKLLLGGWNEAFFYFLF